MPGWDNIQQLVNEWKPDLFVVGLPYNLDGSESELLARAIKFANRLNGRFNIPCFGIDERLSSKAAIERVVEENSGDRKKAAIDDVAAQIILENWFAEYLRETEEDKGA
jgi:putative Holliday junction resolvase